MNRATKIQEAFSYDPRTGIFRWKKHRFKKLVGQIAGCLHKQTGYWFLSLKGKKVKGHIAAWVCFYDVYPNFDLDHRDLNKANNRIKNLRQSNKSNNGANRPPQKNNTSGYKGVFWMKRANTWLVQIRARNKLYYVGIYKDKQEAVRAYDAAAIRLFGSYARTNLKVAA